MQTHFTSGTPEKVKSVYHMRYYSLSALVIAWDPLPSLNLTSIDPDILYTVEFFNNTCGQNIFISSKVVSTNNATEDNLDLMQIYMAVVAAKNNVRGPGYDWSKCGDKRYMYNYFIVVISLCFGPCFHFLFSLGWVAYLLLS